MIKKFLAILVVLGLLVAEGVLYVLAGKVAENVRGPLSLALVVLIGLSILVALMLSVARR